VVDGALVLGAFPAFRTFFPTTFLFAAFLFAFLGDFFTLFLGTDV
jgi:hypothetical protein